MKIYWVGRTDDVDYDEYDSFVVIAEDEQDAVIQCNNDLFRFDNTVVDEIIPENEKKGIVLGSFNAG